MTDNVAGPDGSVLSEGLGPLLPCPLCGADKGYTLAEGTTYRWWYVSCAACGDEVGECAADRGYRNEPLPTRWRRADEHWNRVGAHAQKLRDALATESSRKCASEHDCVWQPHCAHAGRCMRPERPAGA